MTCALSISAVFTPMRHHRPSRLQKRHKLLASLRVSPVDSAATSRKNAAMTTCSTNRPQMATDILHKLYICVIDCYIVLIDLVMVVVTLRFVISTVQIFNKMIWFITKFLL